MNHQPSDYAYDLTRQMYPQLNIPERAINPPEEIPVSLDEAEKRLKADLLNTGESVYWDEFIRILRAEPSDIEADMVALALMRDDFMLVGVIMRLARDRAYRKCAEQFMTELCS